jgi:cbb3-type cytochrome oxidase subunit 3
MKSSLFYFARRLRHRQQGVAAVELAAILPILLILLTIPVFYARCQWHYTAAQKAAYDAARYLSSVPLTEMLSPELAEAAGAQAVEIAKREIAELAPGTIIRSPKAYCGGEDCGYSSLPAGTPPSTVNVTFKFSVTDPIFGLDFGWDGVAITAKVTMNYVGN